MVDPIGTRPIDGGVARIAATAPVVMIAPATTTVAAPTGRVDLAQVGALAQTMAASPPIDGDRVATIKKAIADGNFPIVPATIADRLIALKLQWNPHDEA